MQTRSLCTLNHTSVEEEKIEIFLAQAFEGLLGEGLHGLQVRQLQGQHGQAVLAAVVLQLSVGLLRGLRVSRAQNEGIGLSLRKQLFDQLKTLHVKDISETRAP